MNQQTQAAQPVQKVVGTETVQPKQMTEQDALAQLKAKRAAAANPEPKPEATEEGEAKAPETPQADAKPEDAEAEGQKDGSDVGEHEAPAETDETLHAVKVDGQVENVTTEELKRVYAAGRHLEKQRNEIVADRQKLTTQLKGIDGLAERYQAQLGHMQAMMQQGLPQLPSPQQMQEWLKTGDTANYLKGQAAIATFQNLQNEQQRVAQQRADQEKSQQAEHEAAEIAKLQSVRPDFKNPQYAEANVKFLKDEVGVDVDFIDGSLTEHWMWLLVDDARRYREGNKNRSKAVKEALQAPKQIPSAPVQAPEKRSQPIAPGSMKSINDAMAVLRARRESATK